jgi:hypothetical protein
MCRRDFTRLEAAGQFKDSKHQTAPAIAVKMIGKMDLASPYVRATNGRVL